MEKRIPEWRKSGGRISLLRQNADGGFVYPFGVYPERPISQTEGYDCKYLKEEACFYYQIITSHSRTTQVLQELFTLIPEQAFLIVKVHSEDYYKDHDTYISEVEVDKKEAIDWVHRWRDVVFDDGFFGIGLFSDLSANEVFLDEHKTIHVYHNDPEAIESMLDRLSVPFRFELPFFWDRPHYHEPLPLKGDMICDYLTAFEDLAWHYDLYLDDEDEDNLDENGLPLGMTCWKIDIRGTREIHTGESSKGFYATLYLNASSRNQAVELVDEFLEKQNESVDIFLQVARIPFKELLPEIRSKNFQRHESQVWHVSDRMDFDWPSAD